MYLLFLQYRIRGTQYCKFIHATKSQMEAVKKHLTFTSHGTPTLNIGRSSVHIDTYEQIPTASPWRWLTATCFLLFLASLLLLETI
jgi:hypothetical protein